MWAAGATGAMEKMKMIGKTRSAATTITVLLLGTVARTGIAEEIPGLLGSWRATEFTISHPELPPVEMIALGAALWLTIDPGDRYVLTSQSPDQRVPEADAGSWRVISDAQIEIQPDGFSEARPFTVVRVMRILTGESIASRVWRFDGRCDGRGPTRPA